MAHEQVDLVWRSAKESETQIDGAMLAENMHDDRFHRTLFSRDLELRYCMRRQQS